MLFLVVDPKIYDTVLAIGLVGLVGLVGIILIMILGAGSHRK